MIDSVTLEAIHDELSALVQQGLDVVALYQPETGVIDACGDVGDAAGIKVAHPVVVGRRLEPLWLLGVTRDEPRGLLSAVSDAVSRLVTILDAGLPRASRRRRSAIASS